ncbi:MAG: alkaline phosphatase family protein [Phycisphaerae bacterium]|nr:alkaline phosphatase family protein [Phycisphaerae bacterium]
MTKPPVLLPLLLLCVLLVGANCGVPGAAGPADTYGLDFSLPADAPRAGVVIFVVDALNAQVFGEMLEAGKLPAIQKYFVDRGLYAPRAVANTPSVTLANLTSIITGQFPGHHGITGINWFDRNQLIWRNYEMIAQKNTLDGDYTALTLFEHLHDELTFSIFFQPHRGATKFIENWTSAGPPFLFGWYELVDRLTLHRFGLVMDLARQCGRFPALTVAYLLAPDFRAYSQGVSSEAYRAALVHTDRQIGRVLGDMERAGLLDHVVIVLTSDHGMSDVTQHWDLKSFVHKQVGVRIGSTHWWESDPFEERLEDFQKVSAVPYGSGDRYWALCLRKPIRQGEHVTGFEPWMVRPGGDDLRRYPAGKGFVNLPGVLCERRAVDAVAYAARPDTVRLALSSGEVEFTQIGGPGGPIVYRVIRGDDPLGWSGKVPPGALAGQALSERQWLEATMQTNTPDLPAQIVAYFRSPYAADLAVFAAPGWDFDNVRHAGHGGLRPADMFVPLLLAGPGVPHGRLEAARTVDVVPTVLKLLGRQVPAGLDGQALVP